MLSENEKKRLFREHFKDIDANHDQKISREELSAYLKKKIV